MSKTTNMLPLSAFLITISVWDLSCLNASDSFLEMLESSFVGIGDIFSIFSTILF